MLRIRHDKPLWQADCLGTLEALIAAGAGWAQDSSRASKLLVNIQFAGKLPP